MKCHAYAITWELQEQSKTATYDRRPPVRNAENVKMCYWLIMRVSNELRCWFSITFPDISQYNLCPKIKSFWKIFRVIAYTVDDRTERRANWEWQYVPSKNVSITNSGFPSNFMHTNATVSISPHSFTIFSNKHFPQSNIPWKIRYQLLNKWRKFGAKISADLLSNVPRGTTSVS